MKEQETNLTKAYNRLRELNIEKTTEQYMELSNILFDLSNEQFERGLKTGEEIFKTK